MLNAIQCTYVVFFCHQKLPKMELKLELEKSQERMKGKNRKIFIFILNESKFMYRNISGGNTQPECKLEDLPTAVELVTDNRGH